MNHTDTHARTHAQSECSHLTQVLIDKILRGEIIDLSSLLPPKGAVSEEPASKRIIISEQDGQVVVKKRKVENFLNL